jgi:hypothetical protein
VSSALEQVAKNWTTTDFDLVLPSSDPSLELLTLSVTGKQGITATWVPAFHHYLGRWHSGIEIKKLEY